MAELCKVRGKNTGYTSFRPKSHANMSLSDDFFDYKLSAYLLCSKYFSTMYFTVLTKAHRQLFDSLKKKCLDISSAKHQKRHISLIFVNTAISIIDRKNLVDICIENFQCFESTVSERICANKNDSAYDILSRFAIKIQNRYTARRSDDRKSKISHEKDVSMFSDPIDHISDIYTNLLRSGSSGIRPPIVMFVENMEAISTSVLQDLCHLFSEQSIELILIGFIHESCSLQIRMENSALALIDVNVFFTQSPWALYDEFMSLVLTDNELFLSYHPKILEHIGEKFQRSSLCLAQAVQYFELCVACHFMDRKGLLCMFHHHDWLKETLKGKVARQMKGESDCIFSSINNPIFQDIVASMNKDEWKILDKNANRISSTNASEENGLLVLQEKFKEIAERRRFDVVIFSLVTTIRNHFRGDSSRDFCSDVIWIGLTVDEKSSKLDSRQAKDIQLFFDGIMNRIVTDGVDWSVSTILSIVKKWKSCLVSVEAGIYGSNIVEVMKHVEEELDDLLVLINSLDEIGITMDQSIAVVQKNAMTRYQSEREATQEIPVCAILEGILQDMKGFIGKLLDSNRKLGRPIQLPGILDIIPEVVLKFFHLHAGYLRSSISESCSLEWFATFSSSKICNETLPDTMMLFQHLSTLSGSVDLSDLYDYFSSHCVTEIVSNSSSSSSSSSSSAGNKRKRDDLDPIRYRFALAIREIDKLGLIRLRSIRDHTKILVERNIFAWIG